MDRVLEIIGLLGLPAVIATMLLSQMRRKKRKGENEDGDLR